MFSPLYNLKILIWVRAYVRADYMTCKKVVKSNPVFRMLISDLPIHCTNYMGRG